jgi:hypothetical protein
MADTVFRVHPAIGIGRVGDSEEYYIAPVTAAGTLEPSGLRGGLPIKPGTEDTPITADDFRDHHGNVKRQAARFRIYAYPSGSSGKYPNGGGTLVTVGSTVDGKKVADIVWTVHLANKKLNNYSTVSTNKQFLGIGAYEGSSLLQLRNPKYPDDQELDKSNPIRLRQLVIDPGPRAIKASSGTAALIAFDAANPATYANASGAIVPVPHYPKSFPSDFHKSLYHPLGPLTSLGDLRVDDKGSVIVAGGYARTVAVANADGKPKDPLTQATENGLWYDDAGDGPVNAVIVFDDHSTAAVQAGWYVTGDPGYAPQTRNIVSVWDDVYDSWVRKLDLVPSLYANKQFQTSYRPSFPDDIQPVFHGAMLQRWNTNLPSVAIANHDMVGEIKPTDDPTAKIPNLKTLLRNPDADPKAPNSEIQTGAPLMPLSLGDAEKSFLTVSQTQYFLLNQWHAKVYEPGPGAALGPGERLDRITLENCLGGRYSPGIEVSFPIRDINLYIQDWQQRDCGPFRINQAPLDYSKATADKPFLTFGYIPRQPIPVEPGDVSKFMSVPWHTDYNSCATHLPDPNPGGTRVGPNPNPQANNTLFWSWPAQRPVAVYPQSLCTYDAAAKTWSVGPQVYAVRGDGTKTSYPAQAGRFQAYPDFVCNWFKVGFVIEGPQIVVKADTPPYPAGIFLEVQSQFEVKNAERVPPWPQADVPYYSKPVPERGR